MSNTPNFSFNKEEGGINWGYCNMKKEQKETSITYIVKVETSTLENSETTSTIKMKLFGDKGESKIGILSEVGFERGSTKTIQYKSLDVGNLQKLTITVEGLQGYKCRKISIFSGPKVYTFNCLNKIPPCGPGERDPSKCSADYEADGPLPYEVTVKTCDEENSGTKEPLLLSLLGEKGFSQPKLITERGYQTGYSDTQNVYIHDIGDIMGFKLQILEDGKWSPCLVIIKNSVTNIAKTYNLNNVMITKPGKDIYILDSTPKEPGDGDATDSNAEKSLDLHNPDGGLLEFSEAKNIINLTCEQTLTNPSEQNQIFGPNYPTKFTNYMNILAKCPSDCHKSKKTVYGVGIHPDISPICISAIVDHAVSHYGGIISISIFPGLDKYTVPTALRGKIHNIEVQSKESSFKKSYVIAKVDNVDLVEKDIRILNSKGKLSNRGRIEMRKEGVWGSICTIGNNRESARRICKDIGYVDGEWLSPNTASEGKGFCSSFNGGDYCGAEDLPIHFWKIQCESSDDHFNVCNKSFADPNVCSHNYDAIINCYNENYSNEVKIPEGVIRLENTIQKDAMTIVGRLGMFSKTEFLPICSLKFNNVSAKIACKEMGYEEGEITNEYESLKLPEDSPIGFSASEVQCKQEDKSFQDCKRKIQDVQCQHSQDVIIACSKGNGDPTGKSQYVKPVPNNPPPLSKLGVKSLEISCKERGNLAIFRGDPGSIYLVTCPKHCGRSQGSIWGTGVYTSNSSVCRAAVHAGIIDDSVGGRFAYVKVWGQAYYESNTLNGIKSFEHTRYWPVSFFLTRENSGWINMNKHHTGALGSFLQQSMKVNLVKESSSFLAKNHFLKKPSRANRFFSSFTENKSDEIFIPKPLYEWFPPVSTYMISNINNIEVEKNKISNISKLTFLTSFTLSDFKNSKAFIFSFIGCKGFNVFIDKLGNLIIGDHCTNNRYINTNYKVALNDKTLLYVESFNGSTTVILRSTVTGAQKELSFKVNIQINGKGALTIGKSAEQVNKQSNKDKQNFFYGKIDFLQLYDTNIPKTMIDTIINMMNNNKKPKNHEKTRDGRDCVTACTDNPIPGTSGAPEPPPESKLDSTGSVEVPNISSNNANGDNNGESGKGNGAGSQGNNNGKGNANENGSNFGTFDPREENNIESIDVECNTDLTDNRFYGGIGKFFRVRCKNCSAEGVMVFGTTNYHPKSSICKSALHAGVLTKGGEIIVHIGKGFEVFNGSIGKDGHNSATITNSPLSFSVKMAEKLKQISCVTTAANDIFSQAAVGAKFVVLCPKMCSKMNLKIYGTEIYTDNSPICISAIHYGMINDKGGEVSFIIESGLSDYRGTKGFGIFSESKGNHVRSFRFLGSKSAVTFKFSEDFEGKIDKNWVIVRNSKAHDINSDSWTVLNKPGYIDEEGTKTNLKAIMHTGSIRVTGELNYGSLIHLKNAEWANGIIKFNINLINDNPIACLFRYNNEDNYYGIEFNLQKSTGNIQLFSKIEGSTKIYDSKTIKLLLKKWYRIKIILDFDQIKVFIQNDKIRENKLIFTKPMDGISRGSLAFATNGNSRYFISGIMVDDYNQYKKENFPNNKRSWHNLLKNTSDRKRKIYCRDIFENQKDEMERCIDPHYYCQFRCDELISPLENILNFSCFSDCVRTIDNALGGTEKNKLKNILGTDGWIPKRGENCDYKPKGDNNFTSAVIKNVSKKGENLIVTIKYLNDEMTIVNKDVIYPTPDLVKCGKALTERTDCSTKINMKKKIRKRF